jgi:hypothetical protein
MLFNKKNKHVKIGIIGEIIAKYYIETVKKEQFIKHNTNDSYDLKTNKGLYEVKTDLNYIKFNSIFCEYKSNEKPSGITTSISDFYIFICPNNRKFQEIKTIFLKNLIFQGVTVDRSAKCYDYNNKLVGLNWGHIIGEDLLKKIGCLFELKIEVDAPDLYKMLIEYF